MTSAKKVIALKSELGTANPSTLAQSVIDGEVEPIDYRDFPQRIPDSKRVPTTLPNVEYMLQRYGITVRYNVIKKRVDYEIPGLTTTLDNRENACINHISSLALLNDFKVVAVPGYVDTIADKNSYNPVLEWVESKPWDGEDRMQQISDTLQVNKSFVQTLKDALIRKWIRSAVAALYRKGFHSRGVLTLQGSQGLGKTSWVRKLIPDTHLRESVLKVDHHLDASDKDSKILAIAHWIVEIGELDSSLKKDIARLKGFITADTDKIRRPYAKAESEYQRRTVFCATVNEETFLVDPTGNSRFWTLPVTRIDYQHQVDMQQVFAQAKHEVDAGDIWWLDQQEEAMLAEANDNHRAISAIRELVLGQIKHSTDPNAARMVRCGASEFLKQYCLISAPTSAQSREAGQTFRDFYGAQKKSNGVYKWRIYLQEPSMDLYEDEEEDLSVEAVTPMKSSDEDF